jgi:hypothetical protein
VLQLGLIAALLTLPQAWAATSPFEQLTTPEFVADITHRYTGTTHGGSRSSRPVSPEHCEAANALRRGPAPDWSEVGLLSRLCEQSVTIDADGRVVGFDFVNQTFNRINPRTSTVSSKREMLFSFPERHHQNAHIRITEDAGLTGNLSHDLLESKIIFIPRKVLPYMEITKSGERDIRRVYLPTDESIEIDAVTHEILGGVLVESPMDMNPSRHARRFAGLSYQGKGLMIRVDRRAGTPEHIYTQSFNSNERIKDATITHAGKTCYVNKALLWQNAEDPDLEAYFMHDSDQALLDQVINPRCNWRLKLSDLE